MERQREYRRSHPHRGSKESRKKYNRKARISGYGLTEEQFDLILAAQNYACAMCREPFKAGQRIHVDHDHACCRGRTGRAERASAGSCVIPATSRWATSNAAMRWLVPTSTALGSG
jgi:recombination endonuclease VII